MKKSYLSLLLCLALLAGMLTVCRSAGAALGSSADSLAKDRTALSARQRSTLTRTGYTVQEMESDATVVREYISPSGVVFGIAWDGLIHPDLSALLGSYASQYRDALKHTPRKPGRRRHQVLTEKLVVEKWGHMRNLQGRAYAPALIPPGVSIDDIR